GQELTTEQWFKVMAEAREMGAAQIGFSGGEPLVRQDLSDQLREVLTHQRFAAGETNLRRAHLPRFSHDLEPLL
ncbi:radical SAM protein, partial [Pseudomonas quasicaspiana]|nr:radical SAM protein [Pseudomonas quasicaspiana]